MDRSFTLGFILMGIYIFGQIFFIFYAQSAYKKLRNTIVSKGRLISMIPVLTLTTVSTMVGPGSSLPQGVAYPQQGMPTAPPGYNAATIETKSYPPPYAP